MLKENHKDIARKQLDSAILKKIEQCQNKNPLEPCFFGIWRKYEWLDLINRLTFDKANIDALIFSDFTIKSRTNLPRTLREKVWKKINSGETGICYACEEILDFKMMECAHIIAHSLGGADSVDNLMPTCKKCNRDCGVMNLCAYKKLLTL